MDKNPVTTDHTGRKFSTQREMLDFWGITPDVFWSRRKKGLPLEECLTKGRRQPAYDHIGNKYANKSEMARHYGISVKTMNNRLKSGWTLEKALTTPVIDQSIPVRDHLGKEYSSAKAMAAAYGVQPSALRQNLFERNLPPEQAIFGARHVRDHEGRVFKSECAMCQHYGVTQPLYQKRISEGMSVKDALLTPGPQTSIPCADHLGNGYASISSMCAEYGIDFTTYTARIKKGWSVEKALTEPHSFKKGCTDWAGNNYGSLTEMAAALRVAYHDLSGRPDCDIPDASARACAKRWPGTDAGRYRIRECVVFPWFLCEDLDNKTEAPHAGELILHASKIAALLKENMPGAAGAA